MSNYADWEAVADRAPEELLSTEDIPDVSNISLKDKDTQIIKRRGRGTFSYKKQGLYSDQHSDDPAIDISEDEVATDNSQDTAHGSQDTKIRDCMSFKFIYFAINFIITPSRFSS